MLRRPVLHALRRLSTQPPVPLGELTPKSAPPAAPQDALLSNTNAPTNFTPQKSYPRQSYEIPNGGVPPPMSPPSSSKKYLPLFIALGGVVWGYFAYQFAMDDTPTEYLALNRFTPFVITSKLDIDRDHYLIELTPKFSKWKNTTTPEKIWDGNKCWSVEIKQPQINVVRRYTPLPLELYHSEFTSSPVVRVQDDASAEGKMVLYIKKYSQGEVARWIDSKPIGSELELRGPYVEFKFPVTKNNNLEKPRVKNVPSDTAPDPKWPEDLQNIAYFAGGTGITPALQVLLSRNPYRGFIDVYYSHRTDSEVPIPNILTVLEKCNRVKFHHGAPKLKQIPSPSEKGVALAMVCGPDGFVKCIAGAKPFEAQGPLGGMLKQKGWKQEQVYKME